MQIVNESKLVSNEDLQLIINAINSILPTFCSDWDIPVTTVSMNEHPIKIHILDKFSNTQFPAFHSIEKGIPFGIVFAHSILYGGGSLMYTDIAYKPVLSRFLCHEVFEILVNPTLTRIHAGVIVEVCDPVSYNDVIVDSIIVSDWVLPSWFGRHTGPYNHLKTLNAPFSVSKGGYIYK